MYIGDLHLHGHFGQSDGAQIVYFISQLGIAVQRRNGAVDDKVRLVFFKITFYILWLPQAQSLAVGAENLYIAYLVVEIMHQGAADKA